MEGDRAMAWIVRRLTPVEFERLQGFPDNWTDIGGSVRKRKGEYVFVPGETPDTPRYRAIGNSMAVPVMEWIGKRIMECEKECD